MKKLLAIIVLGLFCSYSVLADNIKNYEIEGMSIGDSLLDFMSESEIKNNEIKYWGNKKKKYSVTGIINNLNTYNQVEVYYKSKDKKYKIEQIAGMMFIDNLDECLQERETIIKSFGSSFSNLEKNTAVLDYAPDKTGKSKQHQVSYFFNKKNSNMRVECVQFSQKMKKEERGRNHLNVTASSDKITTWAMKGYK